ncbi:MAG: HAD hydrolase-like protein [Candidatus Saganbacteria bacterium]|nr:HAD hydrolase-like protein [Candidatus Saganbacteria bacterium]
MRIPPPQRIIRNAAALAAEGVATLALSQKGDRAFRYLFGRPYRYGAARSLSHLQLRSRSIAKGDVAKLREFILSTAFSYDKSEVVIIFDLSGTLLEDGITDGIRQIAQEFGIAPDASELNLMELLKTGKLAGDFRIQAVNSEQYWHEVITTIIRWLTPQPQASLSPMARSFRSSSFDLQKAYLQGTILSKYKEIPEMFALLEQLREQGFDKMACLTNADQDRVESLWEKFGALRECTHPIASYHLRAKKPAEIAYLRAAKLARKLFGPSQLVIFVDDTLDNLEKVPEHLNWVCFNFKA